MGCWPRGRWAVFGLGIVEIVVRLRLGIHYQRAWVWAGDPTKQRFWGLCEIHLGIDLHLFLHRIDQGCRLLFGS